MTHPSDLHPTVVPMATDLCYSGLHHERSYLLSALASEESRAEKLTRSLEATRVKLMTAQADQDHEGAAGLRKIAASITRRLKKCQDNERAMTNNLAAVTSRMQFLEQHQWRRAQFECSQRMQISPIDELGLGFQGMTLEPPVSSSFACPHSPYPPTFYAMSPFGATMPALPAPPMLQPQRMMSIESTWDTPLPTPHQQHFQVPLGMAQPFDGPQAGASDMWKCTTPPPSPSVPFSSSNERSRRLSLPTPPAVVSSNVAESPSITVRRASDN